MPIVAALVLLLSLHVGVYCVTVDRARIDTFELPAGIFSRAPEYQIVGKRYYERDFVHRFFFPLHWLDRKFRPAYWEEPLEVNGSS